MKSKNKKVLKKITISATSALLFLSTCVFTNYRYNWINYLLDKVNSQDDSQIKEDIVNKGIEVKTLSTQTNSDGVVTKVFSYTILPENATIKEVAIELKYKDGSSCEQAVEAMLDQENQQISVKCKQDFDQQIILKIYSTKWPDVYSTVTIDYQEKVKNIVANEDIIYYDGIVDLSGGIDLFKWEPTKYTIPKNDYTFTLSGGNITNIDSSQLYYPLDYSSTSEKNFIDAFTKLLKDNFFKEVLECGFDNDPYQVSFSSEDQLPTGTEVWNLTQDNQIHSTLVMYWENGRDQEILDQSYIYLTISNILATCSNGEVFTFSLNLGFSLIFNYSSCYTPVSDINTNIPSIIF